MPQIDFYVACQVAQEKLDILETLLNEFLPFASIPNLDHLQGVLVVAGSDKEQVIDNLNLIHKGKEQGTYVVGAMVNACAVPIETDTELICYVLLTESFLRQIDPQNPYAIEIVLPLLEELLHIRLYSMLWEQQGFLYPNHELPCTKDLFRVCSAFHDEYIVNRWKYEIVMTQMKIVHEGKLESLQFGDYPLLAALEQAQATLFDIIHEAAAKNIHEYDAWFMLLNCIYRNVFELLARYEAPIAALGIEVNDRPIDPSQNQFYQHYIAGYWDQIQNELERSYTSGIKETPQALQNIVKTMERFLANIGVRYYKTAPGDCRIDFVVR